MNHDVSSGETPAIGDPLRTEIDADGVRYLLPRRQLGAARHLGWILFGAGLFGTLFMMLWMAFPITEGVRLLNQGQRFGLGLIGFGLLGLMGLIPALGFALSGLATVGNRTRCIVSIRNGKIQSTERIFWFAWRRKCVARDVTRLRVTSDTGNRSDDKPHWYWLGDCGYAIVAEHRKGKKFLIAPGYPRPLLLELARELAPRIEADLDEGAGYFREVGTQPVADKPRTVAVVDDEAVGNSREREPVLKPAACNIELERREDGITLRLPPVGIWRGSRGLFFFSLMWNGFVAVFLGSLILALLGVVEPDDDTNPWIMLLFLTPFVAVGVGTLLAAVNMGRRHCVLATAYDSLLVVHHSIFGKKVRQWTVDQVARICAGPSGMEVNDRPIMELQIHPLVGKKYGVLGERDENELAWIAYELNESLGLADRQQEDTGEQYVPPVSRDREGDVVLPAGSAIRFQQTASGIEIHIPSRGIRKSLGLIIPGVLFTLIGFGVTIGVLWSELDDGLQARDLFGVGFIGIWTLLFTGAGLVALIAGLVTARRRFSIDVTYDRLQIDRYGPFGHKILSWHVDDLKDVCVSESDFEIDNRKLQQIQVRPRDGKRFGMMTNWSAAELAAVAAAIRDALDIHG